MPNVNLFVAFGAGILSFFSPCIVPLLPVFLSFITGLSVDELKNSGGHLGRMRNIIIRILIFILGFTFVFVFLGVAASLIGNFVFQNKSLIRTIGGIIILIFGLHIMGVLKFRFMQYEKKIHLKKRPAGMLGPLVIGMLFGFGWTPCVGPILGTILTLAATEGKVLSGVLLLSIYSLGLAIPFLLTGLFIDWFLVKFVKVNKYLGKISLVSGIVLVVVGILMILGMIF